MTVQKATRGRKVTQLPPPPTSAVSGPRRRLRQVIGWTVSGPIELVHGVVALAPISIVIENLAELGRRSLDSEAQVVGSVAARYTGEGALCAHLAFTGFTIGSLVQAPLEHQRALFDELTVHLLTHEDATGLESLYLSSWQQVWTSLNGPEQRRATDLWNHLVMRSRVARTHGVVVFDEQTNTVTPIDPHLLEQAGTISPRPSDPWAGGHGPDGHRGEFPNGEPSDWIPQDPSGDPNGRMRIPGFPGSSSGFSGSGMHNGSGSRTPGGSGPGMPSVPTGGS